MRSSRRWMAALTITATVLSAATAGAQICAPAQPCGDINDSNTVTVTDALGILQYSIGLDLDLQCACEGGVTCDQGILLSTGQTMCWNRLDTANPIDPIDCPSTGQDGEERRGIVRSLIDNLDGTLTDPATGLVWEKLSDDGSPHDFDNFAYQWAGAFDKMGALNDDSFAGYTDWRLPNTHELATLIDFSAYNPAVGVPLNSECEPGCNVTECSCTRPSNYWTSTTSQNTPASAWSINFQSGALATTTKTTLQYVRAVRGGYVE